MTGPADLEIEIGLAKQSRAPVLITAPADRAVAVAHAIAAGVTQTKPAVVMCDGSAVVRAARPGGGGNGTGADEVVLVVREVHALSDTEQAALMLLFDRTIDDAGHRRIIATSSVCLFDRVKRGMFDAGLFYRLNIIHIVSDSCSDRVRVARPCCSEEEDDSSWESQDRQSTPCC
jgi:transcriptional regulator of acetoin/glycerol metabolism